MTVYNVAKTGFVTKLTDFNDMFDPKFNKAKTASNTGYEVSTGVDIAKIFEGYELGKNVAYGTIPWYGTGANSVGLLFAKKYSTIHERSEATKVGHLLKIDGFNVGFPSVIDGYGAWKNLPHYTNEGPKIFPCIMSVSKGKGQPFTNIPPLKFKYEVWMRNADQNPEVADTGLVPGWRPGGGVLINGIDLGLPTGGTSLVGGDGSGLGTIGGLGSLNWNWSLTNGGAQLGTTGNKTERAFMCIVGSYHKIGRNMATPTPSSTTGTYDVIGDVLRPTFSAGTKKTLGGHLPEDTSTEVLNMYNSAEMYLVAVGYA